MIIPLLGVVVGIIKVAVLRIISVSRCMGAVVGVLLVVLNVVLRLALLLMIPVTRRMTVVLVGKRVKLIILIINPLTATASNAFL